MYDLDELLALADGCEDETDGYKFGTIRKLLDAAKQILVEEKEYLQSNNKFDRIEELINECEHHLDAKAEYSEIAKDIYNVIQALHAVLS